MKSLCRYLTTFALLTMLVACGKDNKSGTSSNYPFTSNNGTWNPLTSGTGVVYGNFNLDSLLQQSPCLTGYPNRTVVEVALPNFPYVVQAGDVYAGVTTAGDIAVILGQGTGTPIIRAYVCQRMGLVLQGQFSNIGLGTATRCTVKPIVRTTLSFPYSSLQLDFRQLDGGRLVGNQLVPFQAPVCY